MDGINNMNQSYQPQYWNTDQIPYQQVPYQQAINPYQQAVDVKSKRMSQGKKGFILGLISVILLPLFYNPFMLWIVWIISIVGLVYSIKGLKITPKGFAIAGLILSAFPIASHFAMWFISDLLRFLG